MTTLLHHSRSATLERDAESSPPAQEVPAAADAGARRVRAAVGAVLVVTAAVVPCVFTTRPEDVFTLPKLAALWGALVLAMVVVSVGAFLSGWPVLAFTRRRSVDVALAAFLVWNVAATIASSDAHQSLFGERFQYQGLLTLFLYSAYFVLARISITDERMLSRVFRAVAIGSTLVALYALVQKLGLDPIWKGYLPAGRVFSSIGQANALAGFLVLAIPITTALCWGSTRFVRFAALGAVVAMTTAVSLTFSRGGYLALLVMVPTALVVAGRSVRANLRRVAAGLGVSFAIGALLFVFTAPVHAQVDDSWNRLASSTDVGEASVRTHLDFWNVAIDITRDHPVFGTGPETYPDVFPRYIHTLPYFRAVAISQYRIESPRDVYLAIASGAGIPALAAYLALLAAVGVVLARAARVGARGNRVLFAALFTAFVGHLVTDLFVTADLATTWLFWVLMGAGVAVALRRERAAE